MNDSIIGTEFLPNVHIENISYQDTGTHYRVEIEVTLYDYHSNPTWSRDEIISKYLSVKLLLTKSPNTINALNNGTITIDDPGTEIASDKELIAFSSFEKSPKTEIREKTYTKFTSRKIMQIRKQGTQKLSCYAATFMDLETMKKSESLDISHIANPKLIGSVKGEAILPAPEKGYVFFKNGVPWSGPVHLNNEGEYMEGSQHSENSHSILQQSEVPGEKVYENESFESIFQIQQTTKGRGRFRGNHYQEKYLENEDGNISNIFFINTQPVLFENSHAAKLIFRNNHELFTSISENININHIEINRYRMKDKVVDYESKSLIVRSHNSNSVVEPKERYQVDPSVGVNVNPSELGKMRANSVFTGVEVTEDLIKNAIKVGSIQQLDLNMPKNIRALSFSDLQMKNQLGGSFKYEVKIEMTDQYFLYCKNLLNELLRYSKSIENLSTVLMMKNVFKEGRFEKKFLTEFYAQYGIEVNQVSGFPQGVYYTNAIKNSYLYKSIIALNKAERIIGQKQKSIKLFNSLNLFVTNLNKINQTLSYYNKIIDNFKATYKLSDGPSYEKSSTKSRKDRGVIEAKFFLGKKYEKAQALPVFVGFLPNLNQSAGMSYVSPVSFGLRMQAEVDKFFSISPTAGNPALTALSSDEATAISNLDNVQFASFTPMYYSFAGQTVDTTKINAESFDTEFFQNIRFAAALINSMSSGEEQGVLDQEEPKPETHIDSREYLGSNSKFNRAMVQLLVRNPAKFVNNAKSYRPLSNSMMKAHNQAISLDTFSLTSPNSLVYHMIKENPSNIPIQIRALSMLNTETTNYDLTSIEFDPVSNPYTQEVFIMNYLNFAKVEVLKGFEVINGVHVMNKPIYEEVGSQTMESYEDTNYVGRVVSHRVDGLPIDIPEFKIMDEVFVMGSMDSAVAKPEPEGPREILETLGEPMEEVQSEINVYPFEYSTTIITQNPNNTSAMEGLVPTQEQTQTVNTSTTAQNSNVPQNTGGGY